MTKQMLTLQEAAFIARKSTQTIRRLIKSNKLNFRRRRTPQGFVYSVDKDSVMDYFDLMPRVLPEEPVDEIAEDKESESVREIKKTEKTSLNTEKKSVFNAKITPAKKDTDNNVSLKGEVYDLNSQNNLNSQNREKAGINAKTNANIVEKNNQEAFMIGAKQIEKFSETINNLITQHNEDKKNLYGVINNYQLRIKQLEDQVKMLNAPSHKKWYQFWK